jgi:hypothetical protein
MRQMNNDWLEPIALPRSLIINGIDIRVLGSLGQPRPQLSLMAKVSILKSAVRDHSTRGWIPRVGDGFTSGPPVGPS